MFANFIKAIKSFFASIFGGKKEETSTTVPVKTPSTYTPVETVIVPASCIMSDSVKSFLLSGHTAAVQEKLVNDIAKHEAAGDCEYTLTFDDANKEGFYNIKYGQIAGSGVSPKASEMAEKGKMSPAVRNFLLSGHSDEEKASINAQIDAAEAAGETVYYITHARGYYKIDNGQIAGSAVGV